MSDWQAVCNLDDIPRLGSRVVRRRSGGEGEDDIALFRTQGEVFALKNKCPHKGGPLSEGIVHGKAVTCPLHGWKLRLESGEAVAPDVGCARRHPVKVENGVVYLQF